MIEPYRFDKHLNNLRCLCELTDNAFDADARLVQHLITPGVRYICEDDGHGADDISRLIALGESGANADETATLPGLARMFGMGGKAAGIKLSDAGIVIYITIHQGWRSQATADWATMSRTNCCEISDLVFGPKGPDEKDGTRIIVQPCPRRWEPDKLCREMGFLYGDTLRDRRIVLVVHGKAHEVRPWERPRLSHEHPIRFDFAGGEGGALLTVTGRVGLAESWPDGISRAGWYGQFAHRRSLFSRAPAVIAGGAMGPNLFGEFVLPPGWRNINLTKDGIGRGEEEFWEIMADQCRPVIELDRKAKAQFDINDLGDQISEALSDALPAAKEKRDRPDPPAQPGTRVPPEEPSGRRRRPKKTQPGDVVGPTPGGIRTPITFAFEPSAFAVWVALHRATAHIVFSLDSPAIAGLQEVDKRNLIPFAAMAFCQQVAQDNKQAVFGFEPDSACLTMFDQMMAKVRMEDGRPILKILSS